MKEAAIAALFTGRTCARWQGRAASAIGKDLCEQPLRLARMGFEGDEQADLRGHGGPEKAVHHYPADHYPVWVR